MSAYVIANFTVTNPDGYKAYVPGVIPTLEAHGAEVLAADYKAERLEGDPGSVMVVIRFPSKDAVHAWYRSPEYQAILPLRTDNSEGVVVVADEFDLETTVANLEKL